MEIPGACEFCGANGDLFKRDGLYLCAECRDRFDSSEDEEE